MLSVGLYRKQVVNAAWHNARLFSSCGVLRSGHNKWSTIKHDKAKNDSEKNKLFSKFANQISLAVKLGGSADPNLNMRLAAAIEAANKNNVTKRVIENAIKKASGNGGAAASGSNMDTCLYEGMGPGGVAVVVEALTDNKNRTVSLVRSAFNKASGSMTPTLYFFDRKGYVTVVAPEPLAQNEDQLLEKVLEVAGVEDLEAVPEEEQDAEEEGNGRQFEVTTDPQETNNVALALRNEGFKIKDVSIGYVGKKDMCTIITDADTKSKITKFMESLDTIEDVIAVHTNLQV